MSWKLHRWVWRLESPLFIGIPPAGSLNRCRTYLPARTLSGALAAELARLRCPEGTPPDYGKFSHELGKNCRFTYLYPAQRIDGDYHPWLPCFQLGGGLVWRRQDRRDESISDRSFRRCLVDSLPGTAIDPDSDSAAGATLHETECLGPSWRTSPLDPKSEPEPVFLLGYVFLRNNSFSKLFQNMERLFLGGDTRYGLGRVRLQQWRPCEEARVFGKAVVDETRIKSKIVWGHAPVSLGAPSLLGRQEILTGWHLNSMRQGELTWAPGSVAQEETVWAIDNFSRWILEP